PPIECCVPSITGTVGVSPGSCNSPLRLSVAFDEQSLGGVAPPRVGMFEGFDEIGSPGLAQGDGRPGGLFALESHAPDAAELGTCAPWHLVSGGAADEVRVLDKAAVKVDDVKCAVGAGGEVDGMKPGIGRGEKLAVLFGAPGDECWSAFLKDAAVDE